MRWLLVLLLMFVSLEAQADQVFTIIVGNNASPPEDESLRPLQFADDDAARYYDLFGRGADEQRLLSVLDADTQRRHPALAALARSPTLANLDAALAEFRMAAQTGKWVLYFVFSGHGADDQNGEPYLALLDRGLTKRMLFDRLSTLPAERVHLIIDACNAGAVVDAKGPFDKEVDARPVDVTLVETQALAKLPHVGAIVATSAGQESHEWSRYQSGVFTHELLSAALGAADVNGDLSVEYSEIQAFVAAANSRVEDPRAKPAIRAIPPAIDQRTPFFRLGKGPFLKGRAANLGHFFIELENGQRYADAHLSPSSDFVIALPRDRRAFLRTAREEAELPPLSDGVLDLSALSFKERSMASRGAIDAEYRRALFAAAYDETYYRGYVDSRALVAVPFTGARVDVGAATFTTREKAAIGLWAGAGAGLIATAVTAALAAQTRSEFDRTELQVEAQRLADRHDRLRTGAWVSATITALAAIAGGTLWLQW